MAASNMLATQWQSVGKFRLQGLWLASAYCALPSYGVRMEDT
jgi:hypothetical protein